MVEKAEDELPPPLTLAEFEEKESDKNLENTADVEDNSS